MQTQTLIETDKSTDGTEPDAETGVLVAVPPQSRVAHHPEAEPEASPEPAEPPAGALDGADAAEPVEAPPPARSRAADTSGPSSDLFRQYLREIGRIPCSPRPRRSNSPAASRPACSPRRGWATPPTWRAASPSTWTAWSSWAGWPSAA